jgi:hypothetical protein
MGYFPHIFNNMDNKLNMVDLTKLNGSDLKKEIFELCQYIMPDDLLTENSSELHIFHDIKIIKTDTIYTVIDCAKEKKHSINNKFILYMIKQELEALVIAVQTEVLEEIESEAGAEIAFIAEPNPILIEEIDRELRLSHIFEEEVID